MKLSLEFVEEFVCGLDAVEFGIFQHIVRERTEREAKALAAKIGTLKATLTLTDDEQMLLSQRDRIGVIKSFRHRMDLGLREAKMLLDAASPIE